MPVLIIVSGNPSFLRKVWFFGTWGDIPSGGIVLRMNSTCLTSKWPFFILSFILARLMLEDCPNVPDEVRSIVGCNSNFVQSLGTLVSFDNWVEVPVHEARKGRHRSAKTLCKFFVGKNSSSKNWFQVILPNVDPPSANTDKPGSFQACRMWIFMSEVVLRLTKGLPDEYY